MPDEADGRPELKNATPCDPEQVCMPQTYPDRRSVEDLAVDKVSACFADTREVLLAG